MDRIKRLSYEVLDEHKSKFGEDFADNKKVLDQISIIRSKGLKNEVAGYITKHIKRQIREEKAKQAQRNSVETDPEPVQEEAIDVQDVFESSVDTPEVAAESTEEKTE